MLDPKDLDFITSMSKKAKILASAVFIFISLVLYAAAMWFILKVELKALENPPPRYHFDPTVHEVNQKGVLEI